MLSVCDFVVICCPLTPETTHLFTSKEFKAMKSTAHLVNVARGKYNKSSIGRYVTAYRDM